MELKCASCAGLYEAPQDDEGTHVVTLTELTVFQQIDRRVAVPVCAACTTSILGDNGGG